MKNTLGMASDSILPELVRGDAGTLSSARTDDHVIQLWLRGKSENSRDAYVRDIRQFFDFADISLAAIKLEHLWGWDEQLHRSGKAVSTRARKLASIKSLLSFAHKIGFTEFNVGAAVSLPKIPDMLAQRILSEDELHLILDQADTSRNRLLLRLFYVSGARVSELVMLCWKHVTERRASSGTAGQITVVGKGEKARNVLVTASVWKDLMELRQRELADGFGRSPDPVFRSSHGGNLSRQQMWRIVKSATKAAGIDKDVSPHWLRHAHASHAMDRGAPTHLVKETLGHKSLTTTSKYSHARPDDSSGTYLDV
ncbi:MAG: tyrosine-type recombinase/integrase [Rhodothermales bacterium]